MIRPATLKDIHAIYPLIHIIWEDMNFPLLNLLDNETFRKTMLHLMATETAKFSYRNAWVYEQDNDIKGVLYGYHGSCEQGFDEQFHTFIDEQFPQLNIRQYQSQRESHDNEWYLDAIVVKADSRGKGIAKAFFNQLNRLAPPHTTIGLNCELNNHSAKKLYMQLGFETQYQVSFLSHTYWHMQKVL